MVDDVVGSRSFADRGYVKPERVRELARNPAGGDPVRAAALWRCVNLELWLRRFIDAPAAQTAPLLHA